VECVDIYFAHGVTFKYNKRFPRNKILKFCFYLLFVLSKCYIMCTIFSNALHIDFAFQNDLNCRFLSRNSYTILRVFIALMSLGFIDVMNGNH